MKLRKKIVTNINFCFFFFFFDKRITYTGPETELQQRAEKSSPATGSQDEPNFEQQGETHPSKPG